MNRELEQATTQEISKLLSDLYDMSQEQNIAKENEIIQVEVKGSSF